MQVNFMNHYIEKLGLEQKEKGVWWYRRHRENIREIQEEERTRKNVKGKSFQRENN